MSDLRLDVKELITVVYWKGNDAAFEWLKAHDAELRNRVRIEETKVLRDCYGGHNAFEPDNCSCFLCQHLASLLRTGEPPKEPV